MLRVKILVCLVCLASYHCKSQELEPRAYTALPKNLNAVAIAYAFSLGNVLTDPSLPISNFKVNVHGLAAAYVHTFAVGNKLARVQVNVPFMFISEKLQINGHDTSGVRNGFADAKIRLGINLTGSPAFRAKRIPRVYSKNHNWCKPYHKCSNWLILFRQTNQPRKQPVGIQTRGRYLETLQTRVCRSICWCLVLF